jgi:pimeloyl-ACP methyl ester carboxylesterase
MSIPAVARLAASVLDELGHSTADVVGFSHGGAVAQQLAVDVPERVRRLTLVSTSCGYGATPPGWDLLGVRTFYPVWDTFGWPRPDILATVWHAYAFTTWTSIPFLAWIQAPTLVVSGARDRIVPPANSRLLAQRIPDARLVLLPGGHDLQRPRPAVELAAAVERFLGGGS